MLQTVRAEKVDIKNGVICSLPELRPLNCLKKVHFLQFCADLSEKSIKAIYIHVSPYALSENGIVYYAITYCFGDIGV